LRRCRLETAEQAALWKTRYSTSQAGHAAEPSVQQPAQASQAQLPAQQQLQALVQAQQQHLRRLLVLQPVPEQLPARALGPGPELQARGLSVRASDDRVRQPSRRLQ